MSTSNAWAEFAAIFARTQPAYLEHEKAKAELKTLDTGGCAASYGPWHSAPNGRNPAPSHSNSSKLWMTMQQSSSSIGNLAAALAKAQAELVNPEKSMDRYNAGGR